MTLMSFGYQYLEQFEFEQKSKVSPKGFTGEAITYSLNEWKNLNEYIHNGELSISNDYVERAIRPFTISRKNWIFSDTA